MLKVNPYQAAYGIDNLGFLVVYHLVAVNLCYTSILVPENLAFFFLQVFFFSVTKQKVCIFSF